jgi:tetratricopeptide (TPR) repeat protein
MKSSWVGYGGVVARWAGVTLLVLASLHGAKAQMPGAPPGQIGTGIPNQTQIGQTGGTMTDQLQFGTMGHEVEREQDAAYKKLLKEPEPAKKIELGNGFLQKYPKSPLEERVDYVLMNAYRERKDWTNTYRFADSALALDPDDVDVLATIGWTIPHVSNPKDPDADQQLVKAETYANHALDVLSKIKKPRDLTDAQFAAAKSARTFQAHSALGIVDFRRNDYDNSAKELEQATNGNPSPDPTDLFILGVDHQNMKRYGEAAQAFGACAQIAGPLQDRCKQSADATKAADASKSQ